MMLTLSQYRHCVINTVDPCRINRFVQNKAALQ